MSILEILAILDIILNDYVTEFKVDENKNAKPSIMFGIYPESYNGSK
jgi:hypothetical protein